MSSPLPSYPLKTHAHDNKYSDLALNFSISLIYLIITIIIITSEIWWARKILPRENFNSLAYYFNIYLIYLPKSEANERKSFSQTRKQQMCVCMKM